MGAAFSAVLTLLAVVATIVLYRCLGHPLARYPGPASAASSNLWQIFTFFSGNSHIVVKGLHEKYGPVVRVGPSSLSLSDLAAHHYIRGAGDAFERGPYYDFARDPSTGKGSILSIPNHSQHKPVRRMIGPALTATKVQSYEPTVLKNVQLLLDAIAAQHSEGDTDTVDVSTLIHCFLIKTTFETIYGTPLPGGLDAQEHISIALRDVSKFAFGSGYLPWLSWLINSCPVRAFTHRPKYEKDGSPIGMTAIVSKARKTLAAVLASSTTPTSLHPSVLRSFGEAGAASEKRLSNEQISTECLNLMIAGQGSTTASLTAVFYELSTSQGQEWQHRIRKEALRAPDAPALALNAVIKETLRFHPPFACGFPLDVARNAEPSQIPGLTAPLPTGTTVTCNFYVLGRSKEIWGEDADEWKPERWLSAGKEGEGTSGRDLEDRFVVFGKGPRSCLGREIAMKVLTRTVTEILGRWRIESRGELVGKNCFEMQYNSCRIAFLERGRSIDIQKIE